MAPPSKKRRRDGSAVEEVVFDPSARADYLTGFHKRKLQRIKHAQEEAAKREKAERTATRKRVGILWSLIAFCIRRLTVLFNYGSSFENNGRKN